MTEQDRIYREVHAAREAHVRELLSEPNQPVELGKAITEGFSSGYAAAIAHATTPKPLPSADTREGLLARLNARHHSTRTPA